MRTIELIQTLLDDGGDSLETLMERFKVSARTVRSHVHAANQMLEDIALIRFSRKTMYMNSRSLMKMHFKLGLIGAIKSNRSRLVRSGACPVSSITFYLPMAGCESQIWPTASSFRLKAFPWTCMRLKLNSPSLGFRL